MAGEVTLNTVATGGIADSVSGIVLENYIFDDTFEFLWIDVTAGTNLNLTDDATASIDIGFPFTFYGVKYDKVNISANGFMYFSGLAGSYDNASIPSDPAPNNLIAPFWDDLNPGVPGAGVWYLLEGDAGSQRLTVAWLDVPHFPNTGAVSFEATLYEGTNEIKFQYQDVGFGNSTYNNGVSATVGVEHRDGAIGTQYSFNELVIPDNSAILFSLPASPAHSLNITNGPSGSPDAVASEGTATLSVTADDSDGHLLSYLWSADCSSWAMDDGIHNGASAIPNTRRPNVDRSN